jgi:hypothetical protein
VRPRDLNVAELQGTLREQHALVSTDDLVRTTTVES